MAVDVGIDVGLLRSEIRKTYASVSQEPERDFVFPTGRAWAADLGYPAGVLARVPEAAVESFAGVANPFSLGALLPGELVLDVGCGAGTDSLDLIPDKDAVFAEIRRVPRPGGRIQVADVTIQQPLSEEGRRNIDLWTG